jgi:hypothetical protein
MSDHKHNLISLYLARFITSDDKSWMAAVFFCEDCDYEEMQISEAQEA